MNNTDLIYDHYKETCEIVRNKEKQRDRLFLLIIILTGILFTLSIDSNNIINIINNFLNNNYHVGASISVSIIEVILWIILIIELLKYTSMNILIDKRYKYISNLENTINKRINCDDINRERKEYNDNYPVTQNYTYIFYKFLFPMLFFLVIVLKEVFTIINASDLALILIDVVFGIFVEMIITTYFIENIKY